MVSVNHGECSLGECSNSKGRHSKCSHSKCSHSRCSSWHRYDDDVARRVDGHLPRVDHSPLRRQVSRQRVGPDPQVQVHEGLAQRQAGAGGGPHVVPVDGCGGGEQPCTLRVELGVLARRHEAEGGVQVGVTDHSAARAQGAAAARAHARGLALLDDNLVD